MKTSLADATEGISPAVALLASGEVVALPTETVYGLGGSALDPAACAKIFEAKERPLSDPLIVHVPNLDWAGRLAELSPAALKLAARFWPGPLTLVVPRRDIVPDLVTAGQSTVALRMSAHPVFRRIVETFDKPIAAPSANRFGRISPTSATDVLAELDGRIPLIVDGGPCAHGIESTIVHVDGGELHILRRGPITAEELEEFGPVTSGGADVTAPGGLKSHYAPRTPLDLVATAPASPPPRSGLLAWSHSGAGYEVVEHLSPAHDLREAAARLYGAMRRLDASGVDRIFAEAPPSHGLGAAILERLQKASAR